MVPMVPMVPMVGAIVLAGCGARPTAVAACDWTGAHAVLLADDIRHAEDIAIRYADSVGYREGWRQTRHVAFRHASPRSGSRS